MRRDITVKFLAEVVEVGRFVMGIGLGGLIGWVLAVNAASPDAHLHAWNAASGLLLLVALFGLVLWVLGAIVKPDPPQGHPWTNRPHGPPGFAGFARRARTRRGVESSA
jgi:hypothetical protein